jgi:hypothetical protein
MIALEFKDDHKEVEHTETVVRASLTLDVSRAQLLSFQFPT